MKAFFRLFGLFLIFSILMFSACKQFMDPLGEYILDATSMATGQDYHFHTDKERCTSCDDDYHYYIPPGEITVKTIYIRNPQRFDLILGLTGTGSDKATVKVNEDMQSATLTITNPERLDEFNLTMTIETENRPMPSYELPKKIARYLNTDLSHLSVIAYPSGEPITFSDLNNDEFNFNTYQGTTSAELTVHLPDEVHSHYTINGGSNHTVQLPLAQNEIEIVVTSDSGRARTYILNINKGAAPPPIPVEDFEVTALGYAVTANVYTKTYDGNADPVFIDYTTASGHDATTAGDITVRYKLNGDTTLLTSAPKNAGIYDILVSTEGGTVHTNPVVNLKVGEIVINKRAITWATTGTVNTKTYDGNTTATVATHPTIQTSGIVSGDDVTRTNGSAVFNSSNAGNFIDITASGYDIAGMDADNYYISSQPAFTNGTISRRPITITPTTGQSKVYGTTDPVFTYTSSEQLITGNTFTGALSRASGDDVGTYDIELGTLSAEPNYTLTLGGAVSFAITQAIGAAVSVPAVSNVTNTSITVGAVTLTPATTGQIAEYAISTSSSSTWPTTIVPATISGGSVTFSGLTQATTYYVYARSAENGNYSAGAQQVSVAIMTLGSGSITISVDPITDANLQLNTNYQVNLANPGSSSLTVGAAAGFTTYTWFIDGIQVGTGTNRIFTLTAAQVAITYGPGEHLLSLLVDNTYSITVTFTVIFQP